MVPNKFWWSNDDILYIKSALKFICALHFHIDIISKNTQSPLTVLWSVVTNGARPAL